VILQYCSPKVHNIPQYCSPKVQVDPY
jgi:hypothetical protein